MNDFTLRTFYRLFSDCTKTTCATYFKLSNLAFSFGFDLISILTLPFSYAPWLMILNERKRSTCQPFPYFTKWFQMYFNALLAQFFNFPSRYFVLYRSWRVFSFRGLWPPAFHTKNSIRTTLVSISSLIAALRDCHSFTHVFPNTSYN